MFIKHPREELKIKKKKKKKASQKGPRSPVKLNIPFINVLKLIRCLHVSNILETRNLMQGFGKNDGSFFKSFKVEEHVAFFFGNIVYMGFP